MIKETEGVQEKESKGVRWWRKATLVGDLLFSKVVRVVAERG